MRANNKVTSLVGISDEALTTSKNSEIIARHIRGSMELPVKEVLRTKKSVHRELYWEDRRYIVDAEPVFDDSGGIAYVVKSAFDVTRLNALLENQQILNQGMDAVLSAPNTLESMSSLLRTVCGKLQASRAYILRYDFSRGLAVSDFEYSSSDSVANDSGTFTIPISRERLENLEREGFIFIDDLNDENVMHKYYLHYDKSSAINLRSMFLAAIRVNGKTWGSFGLFYEGGSGHSFTRMEKDFLLSVTRVVELAVQRAQYRGKLISMAEEAKSADRAKSFFIASISHEIRTPLNSVIGLSELLKDKSLDAATRADYLDSITYSGNALLQLVNDVLDLSSLEAGKMNFVKEAVDFETLGREVLRVFEFKAREKGIRLISNFSDMPILLADKLRIRQILFNLIGNAVKFTKEGSVSLSASYTESKLKNEGFLDFSVSDTGIGISDSDQKKLMEPFVQLSKLRGTNSGNNGTGLGLAISRRLAEKMGGTLTLKSEIGKGSVFNVRIAADHAEKRSSIGSGAKESGEVSVNEISVDGKFLSALIVDDVQMNLKVLEAICKKSGFSKVVKASSGKEALSALESENFDIVFTDMWMPEMGGAELAAKIRSDVRFAKLPIYAVTADIEAKSTFNMKNLSGLIYKPVTIGTVKRIISDFLTKLG